MAMVAGAQQEGLCPELFINKYLSKALEECTFPDNSKKIYDCSAGEIDRDKLCGTMLIEPVDNRRFLPLLRG